MDVDKNKHYKDLGWDISNNMVRKKLRNHNIKSIYHPRNKEILLRVDYYPMWFSCSHQGFLYVIIDIMEQIIRNNKIEEMIKFMRDFIGGHGCGWKTVSSPDIDRLFNSLLSEGVLYE